MGKELIFSMNHSETTVVKNPIKSNPTSHHI